MKVKFCADCGRLILSDFRYCPYCGEAAAPGPGLEEALSAPFARIEAKAGRGGAGTAAGKGPGAGPDRFGEMAERLDRLESEMDEMLAALAANGG